MEGETVLDKKTEEYRPVCYSDFKHSLRTMSGWAETFKRILSSCGIPASVTTKTGYFSAPEVVRVRGLSANFGQSSAGYSSGRS